MALAELAQNNDGQKVMRYSYFLAAPMSGLPSDAYTEVRSWIMDFIDALETQGTDNFVYYAGRNIPSAEDFSSPEYAISHDLEALKNSKELILIYPKKCHSSAIFEVGMALALGLNVTIFTPSRNELIFMLQTPSIYKSITWLGNVRLIEYGKQLPLADSVAKKL